ncbi:IclR family transcriptional regulator [Ammonicoccus fulvus]|uniref:IclR family transcriptional regulator n=1 Tax=Ammonicoccus fulvus TaxID=3138240 RepID=A0ABZ3FMG0_9ACTN
MSVLSKAAEVVEAIGNEKHPIRLGDLATVLDMPKSSLHRLLVEMVTQGVLRTDGEGAYSLGPRLIRWGSLAADSFDLRAISLPTMLALRDSTQETVNLYVPVDTNRVCIASEPGNRALQHNPMLGMARPAGLGAAGKLVMAYASGRGRERIRAAVAQTLPTDSELDVLRAQRFAISREDMEPGLVVVGAPILMGDHLVGVLALAGVTAIMTPAHVDDLIPQLLVACAEISQALETGTPRTPAYARAL